MAQDFRRPIDTLFMHSLARKWADQQRQQQQMTDATLYAADRSKGLFDERAALAEKMGATAFGTGRPLSDVQTAEPFAPRAQLGYEQARVLSEAAARKAAFDRALKEYEQEQQLLREITKGQFGLDEESMRQQGSGERAWELELGRQRRWEGEAPVRSSDVAKNRAMAGYYGRMPKEGTGTKLPTHVKTAMDTLQRAIDRTMAFRGSAATGYNTAESKKALAELIAARKAFNMLALANMPRAEAEALIASIEPYLQQLQISQGQGFGSLPPGVAKPPVSVPQQGGQTYTPGTADIEGTPSKDEWRNRKR